MNAKGLARKLFAGYEVVWTGEGIYTLHQVGPWGKSVLKYVRITDIHDMEVCMAAGANVYYLRYADMYTGQPTGLLSEE